MGKPAFKLIYVEVSIDRVTVFIDQGNSFLRSSPSRAKIRHASLSKYVFDTCTLHVEPW